MTQLRLFDEPVAPLPTLGGRSVGTVQAKSLLNRGAGYSSAFDYTLNPYVGCTFGCGYCYAAFFVPDARRAEEWGQWVEAKENALDLLRRARDVEGRRIYLGSVTDPYQPVERRFEITRRILEHLASLPRQPRLVVQTRSPLVLRDLDLLRRFERLRVNVTVTTDDDSVRRHYEPDCPSIGRRLVTLRRLKEAGIRTGACLAPLLPVRDIPAFAGTLASLRADVVVAQPFHVSRGPFSSGTRDIAMRLAEEDGWTLASYRETVREIRAQGIPLYEGRAGFMPE